jgi:hypothetical protein
MAWKVDSEAAGFRGDRMDRLDRLRVIFRDCGNSEVGGILIPDSGVKENFRDSERTPRRQSVTG